MAINRGSRLCRLAVVAILMSSCVLASCVRDDSDSIESGGKCEYYPEGTDTYYNFVLRLGNGSDGTRGTLPDGDTPAVGNESLVKNVYVVFFDDNDKFETATLFNVSELTAENGSGNLGSSVTDGYTFKKAIPIKAGPKTVYAIANANSNVMYDLKSFLVRGSTTVSQFNKYELNLLPSANYYPARLDLPKYGDYKAPTLMSYLMLKLLGTNGIAPSSTDGMLMSGFNTVSLEVGVSQAEATNGSKNLVSIYVDRLAAKVSLSFDQTIGYGRPAKPASGTTDYKIYQPAGSVSSVRAYWWTANMPAKEYLNERTADPFTPYYNEHSVFSMWQNKYPYMAFPAIDETYHPVTFAESVGYTPENIVSTPVRGNVTYIVVKSKFTFGGDKEDSFWNGENYKFKWQWYNAGDFAGDPTWEGFGWSFTNGVPLALQLVGTWMIIDEKGERDYIPNTSTKNWSTLMDYFNYRINSTTNDPVTNVLMTTYDKTKAAQDAALLTQMGGATIPAGWYAFSYEAKTLHTNHWYDEMQLYYYNGTQSGGSWVRGERSDYQLAYYKDNFCYYRINLEDVDKPLNSIERYAVRRNDWFDVKIKKIKEVGYPDEEDLASNPDDELSSSWLEVQISVQDWRNGGNQTGTIGR